MIPAAERSLGMKSFGILEQSLCSGTSVCARKRYCVSRAARFGLTKGRPDTSTCWGSVLSNDKQYGRACEDPPNSFFLLYQLIMRPVLRMRVILGAGCDVSSGTTKKHHDAMSSKAIMLLAAMPLKTSSSKPPSPIGGLEVSGRPANGPPQAGRPFCRRQLV